jgi:hypothetical protein
MFSYYLFKDIVYDYLSQFEHCSVLTKFCADDIMSHFALNFKSYYILPKTYNGDIDIMHICLIWTLLVRSILGRFLLLYWDISFVCLNNLLL